MSSLLVRTSLPTNPVPANLHGTLEQLSDAIGWKPTRDIVGLFIDDGRIAMAAIDRRQRSFDAPGLHRALRDLRGITAMMGAHRLSSFCEGALQDRLADMAPRIAELQQEWIRIEWVLSMWMLSPGPATARCES